LSLRSSRLTSVPLGLSNISSTNARIDLTVNNFNENAKEELRVLKLTYPNLSY